MMLLTLAQKHYVHMLSRGNCLATVIAGAIMDIEPRSVTERDQDGKSYVSEQKLNEAVSEYLLWASPPLAGPLATPDEVALDPPADPGLLSRSGTGLAVADDHDLW